jgi:hypothetical protein
MGARSCATALLSRSLRLLRLPGAALPPSAAAAAAAATAAARCAPPSVTRATASGARAAAGVAFGTQGMTTTQLGTAAVVRRVGVLARHVAPPLSGGAHLPAQAPRRGEEERAGGSSVTAPPSRGAGGAAAPQHAPQPLRRVAAAFSAGAAALAADAPSPAEASLSVRHAAQLQRRLARAPPRVHTARAARLVSAASRKPPGLARSHAAPAPRCARHSGATCRAGRRAYLLALFSPSLLCADARAALLAVRSSTPRTRACATQVSDIKALLQQAGVDFRDCFEKRELVRPRFATHTRTHARTHARIMYPRCPCFARPFVGLSTRLLLPC